MERQKKKPLIGVIPSYRPEMEQYTAPSNYLECITRSGGVGVLIPYEREKDDILRIVAQLDGFLFTGGVDIHPSRYGEKALPVCGPINTSRDYLEETVFEHALAGDLPVLGICRGIQVINVFLGGDLYQDIPSQRPDSAVVHNQQEPYEMSSHNIYIDPRSPLFELSGSTDANVNSFHHQAIRKLAGKLTSMATSDDGIVEAVYMPAAKYVWAVQWHPEYMFQRQLSQRLFANFIAACKDPQDMYDDESETAEAGEESGGIEATQDQD